MENLRSIEHHINSSYFTYETHAFSALGGMYDNGFFFVECVISPIANVLADLPSPSALSASFDLCLLIFENKDWKFELCSFQGNHLIV